jgi:hypothetical protein
MRADFNWCLIQMKGGFLSFLISNLKSNWLNGIGLAEFF